MKESGQTIYQRLRRHWMWGLVALIAMVAFLGWWYFQALPMARLRASGAPVSFEDLASRHTPDEGNAARLLEEVRQRLEALPDAAVNLSCAAVNGPLTADQQKKADAVLKRYSDVLSTLDAAAGLPTYSSLLSVEQLADERGRLDDIGVRRSAGRLLTLRTRVALARGELQQACESAIASLRLAKHFEKEPFLVNRLVAIAVEHEAMNDTSALIAAEVPSEECREQLDDACAAIEDRSGYRDMLVSERVMSIEKLEESPLSLRLTQRPGVLRVYEGAIANAPAVGTGVPVRASGPIVTAGPLVRQFIPELQAVRAAENRVAALARCLRIRLALGNTGAGSATDAASLGLPASTFVDPFTGNQLIVDHRPATEEREAGWWVYSAGADLVDDGGVFDDNQTDVGYAPPKRR